MKDLIYRQQAIDAIERRLAEPAYQHTGEDWYVGMNSAESEIYDLPPAQPTLYGYKIEHLACIARVMEKEGVTADYAVRTFDDMSRMIKMIIEEAQQKVEEVLNE